MKNIAIICGGFSGEYDISVQSAIMVSNNLDKTKYNSYIIVIERNQWYYKDEKNKTNNFYVTNSSFYKLLKRTNC